MSDEWPRGIGSIDIGRDLDAKPVMGRMRLREADARYLYRLLAADRLWALVERRWAIEAGLDALTYQQWTARAQRLRNDIEYVANHMGWDLDEPLREDP